MAHCSGKLKIEICSGVSQQGEKSDSDCKKIKKKTDGVGGGDVSTYELVLRAANGD